MANGLVWLGLGAALMYFSDPQNGRRRRADVTGREGLARRAARATFAASLAAGVAQW
ncbi:MAG TPA: hypothetical protein VF031_06645 [Alphaproteobacteria bacterium]